MPDLPRPDAEAPAATTPAPGPVEAAVAPVGVETDLKALQALSAAELIELAEREELAAPPNLDKGELIFAILQHRSLAGAPGRIEGALEVLPDGFGFLRASEHDFAAKPDDVYVSPSQVRSLNLKQGHLVAGPVRPPRRSEKFFALLHVESVNGADVKTLRRRVPFAARTPVLPTERLRLAHPAAPPMVRAIDRLAPWGRGQRVLLELPPEFARARLLCELAAALRASHADLHLLVCLLDERPEEITGLRRLIRRLGARSELVATTFDEPPARHCAVTEMTLARAQRSVEAGDHVVLLLDSLTAYARALDHERSPTGRLACPGLDAGALLGPRVLFGAARNCEEGGSLTVLATALRDDASRVDTAVLEEFRHRGNSRVAVDPDLVRRGHDLPLDALRTATRREDLLLPDAEAEQLHRLRDRLRVLDPLGRAELLATLLADGT